MSFIGITGLGAILPNEPVGRVKKSFVSLFSGKKGNDPGVVDLAYYAANSACIQAGISPADIELVFGSSLSFSNFSAGTTQLAPRLSWGVHNYLKTRKAYAFDIGAADMMLGIETAVTYMASGKVRNVLVVGADQFLPENVTHGNANAELLSGAGAAVVSQGGKGFRFLGSAFGNADFPEHCMRLDLTCGDFPASIPLGTLHLEEPEEAARRMAGAAEGVLQRAAQQSDLAVGDIAHFVLPRWGGPFRGELCDRLGVQELLSESDPGGSFLFTPAAVIDLMKLLPRLVQDDLIAVISYSFGFSVGCQLFQWKGGGMDAQL